MTDRADRKDGERKVGLDAEREETHRDPAFPGGRDFAGQSIASTQDDQTRTRERIVEHPALDEAGEPAED